MNRNETTMPRIEEEKGAKIAKKYWLVTVY